MLFLRMVEMPGTVATYHVKTNCALRHQKKLSGIFFENLNFVSKLHIPNVDNEIFKKHPKAILFYQSKPSHVYLTMAFFLIWINT